MEKTNVMRLLDKAKVSYQWHSYTQTDAVSGLEVAEVLNQDPDRVFKTLVTVGKSGRYYVFMIAVNRELDLKKAAKAVQEKSIEMLKAKELLPLTGYIHGGCSPIGLKKPFPVVVDVRAESFESILFSAGKIGYQVELGLKELGRVIKYTLADLVI